MGLVAWLGDKRTLSSAAADTVGSRRLPKMCGFEKSRIMFQQPTLRMGEEEQLMEPHEDSTAGDGKPPPEKKHKPQSASPSRDLPICVEWKLGEDQAQDPIVLGGESSLLQQLLGPVQQSVFQKDYFQQCAVHISGGGGESDGASRFASLAADHLFDLDPLSLLQETASENLFVWLQDATTNRIHSVEVNDADTAHRLHTTGGHSTYCRAPPAIEHRLVQALLQDTGMSAVSDTTSLARGEVELFLSQHTGAVTDWHFDFQDNFTLQLSGTKQWRLQRHTTSGGAATGGRIRHPLRACTPHYQSPATVESQLLAARLADPDFCFAPPDDEQAEAVVVTLVPGDFLYFPAGLWHRVQVMDDAPGVSLNVSLMATHNVASLTCQALQHWLLRRPEWRQCVLPTQPQQLQYLIEGQLPQLVQNFVDSYGAAAVVPPALRTVSMLPQEEKEEEEDELMDDDDDDEKEELIDVSKFIAPLDGFSRMKTTTQWTAAFQQYELVINPLSCILKQREEIEQYYKTEAIKEELSPDGTEVLVLNVSYAGNECHESLLRVCLRAQGGAYDEVTRAVQLLHGYPNAATASTQGTIRRHAQLVDCFIHFGYLLRKPRKSCGT